MGQKDLSAEMEKKVVDGIPMARRATPEDVADAYLFLASEEAKFLTGVALDIDGGRSIQ
jgi:3-oxoacyl-[acyl-carrier protein] reductase